MLLKNKMLCFLPSLAGSIDDLARQPRQSRGNSQASKGTRIAYREYVGVTDPSYTTPFGDQLLADAADATIGCIIIYMNSPGGLAEGVPELAEIVRRAAAAKPVHVIAEGYLASAALWVASQATTITASPSTLVGSVGSVIVVVDDSEMLTKLGVKVLRIASGPLKGTGIPGVKVEDDEIMALRRRVDMLTAMFEASIMRGRRLSASQVNSIATGEAWLAQQAKNLGLIDRVALFEDAMADVARQLGPSPAADPYAHLHGWAAAKQWDELASEQFGIDFNRFGSSLERELTSDEQRKLTDKYPALAKAAMAF